MGAADDTERGGRLLRAMTVAAIHDRHEEDAVEIVFLESARYYRLPRKSPGYARTLEVLRQSLASTRPVKVGLASLESDIIEDAS